MFVDQTQFAVTESEDLEAALRALSSECHKHNLDVDVHEQSTLRLDSSDFSNSLNNITSLCTPRDQNRTQNKIDQNESEQNSKNQSESEQIRSSRKQSDQEPAQSRNPIKNQSPFDKNQVTKYIHTKDLPKINLLLTEMCSKQRFQDPNTSTTEMSFNLRKEIKTPVHDLPTDDQPFVFRLQNYLKTDLNIMDDDAQSTQLKCGCDCNCDKVQRLPPDKNQNLELNQSVGQNKALLPDGDTNSEVLKPQSKTSFDVTNNIEEISQRKTKQSQSPRKQSKANEPDPSQSLTNESKFTRFTFKRFEGLSNLSPSTLKTHINDPHKKSLVACECTDINDPPKKCSVTLKCTDINESHKKSSVACKCTDINDPHKKSSVACKCKDINDPHKKSSVACKCTDINDPHKKSSVACKCTDINDRRKKSSVTCKCTDINDPHKKSSVACKCTDINDPHKKSSVACKCTDINDPHKESSVACKCTDINDPHKESSVACKCTDINDPHKKSSVACKCTDINDPHKESSVACKCTDINDPHKESSVACKCTDINDPHKESSVACKCTDINDPHKESSVQYKCTDIKYPSKKSSVPCEYTDFKDEDRNKKHEISRICTNRNDNRELRKTMRSSESRRSFFLPPSNSDYAELKIMDTPKFLNKYSSSKDTEDNIISDDCLDPCPCSSTETPETAEKSSSVNQGWLSFPESLIKGLEALRHRIVARNEDQSKTDLSKAEDYPPEISPRQKSVQIHVDIDRNVTYDDTCIGTSHLQKTDSSSSSSLLQSIPDSLIIFRHRAQKSNKIQTQKRMCDFCHLEECDEDDVEYCTENTEVQNPERTDRSQGARTASFDDDFDLRSRSGINRETSKSTEVDFADSRGKSSADRRQRFLRMKLLKDQAVQDSGGGSSCSASCEQFYRDKLMASLQMLKNKDETIRIQNSSLGVAEGRIAELTKRAGAMKVELDQKARELNKLRQVADSYQVDKNDESISADLEDAESQRVIMETLEDNLSVIEELYQKCFYETAKQEDMIEMLRKSYLDVRLMERDKTKKIARLQGVIATQKRSLEQCQDVVMEVESLKSEISSFLNNSNNDSGMWERGSECPDVGEELGEILDQLRQLQAMLTDDCDCTKLSEENKALKERNNAMEMEHTQLKARINELEGTLRKLLDKQHETEQYKIKENEVKLTEKLAAAENTCKEKSETCEALKDELEQAHVILNDKSEQLAELVATRAAQDDTIKQLHEELDKSEQKVEEGLQKLAEVAPTHSQSIMLLESHVAISELEQQLQLASQRYQQLEMTYRETERSRVELEASLADAQERGASLCEESHRVTVYIRRWMCRKRALLSEKDDEIRRQEAVIRELRRCIGARESISDQAIKSETEPCTSRTMPEDYIDGACEKTCPGSRIFKHLYRSETAVFPRFRPSMAHVTGRERSMTGCSKCSLNRQEGERLSGSEMPSYSQAPVPPRRQRRQPCDDLFARPRARASRPSSRAFTTDTLWVQPPRRRTWSPTDELMEQVEQLHAALAAGRRRWGRAGRR